MRKPARPEWLYIDFDSFFAAAEQHLRPELRGEPVGVIPLKTEHTGLIAVSREAKARGVTRGMFVKDARRACPEIRLVAARHEQYVRLHNCIRDVVEDVVHVDAVRSIDEIACRLLSNEGDRAADIGRKIKARLARVIGPCLTCSVGAAPNELLAKIAAEMEKPDGLVVIAPGDLPDALFGLSLTDVPGVASRMEERLRRAGVTTVAALWALAPRRARAIWGGVEGERMWASLHGYAVERPKSNRFMYGHGRVLPMSWRTLGGAAACARLLTVKAARRLRREHFAATTLSLWMTDRTSAGWFVEDRFRPAWDDHSLLASLTRLLRHAPGEAPARPRSVHVALYGLVPLSELTADLFTSAPALATQKRFETLARVQDRLNTKFRRTVLHLGPLADLPGGYAGAKIAFGRIPEDDAFWSSLAARPGAPSPGEGGSLAGKRSKPLKRRSEGWTRLRGDGGV